MEKADIHKVAGVIIKDRKLLVARSKNKNFFVSPGGKVNSGETIQETLKRELKEELDIQVGDSDLKYFGQFQALAQGAEDKTVTMDVFRVLRWEGEITPSSEVEEVMWVDSNMASNIELGSIFKHDVIPQLRALELID